MKRKRITGRQRVARVRNIAIARMHRHKQVRDVRKVDEVVKKYLNKYNQDRPEKVPIKKVVFRTTKTEELSGIKKGERSGQFWTSDPTEYGRHAQGRLGKKDSDKVLIAAKSSGKNKVLRGLGNTPLQHFNELNSRSKRNIIAVYKWDGFKLKRKK